MKINDQNPAADRLLTRDQNNFNLLRLIAAFFVIFSHSYLFIGESEKDFITNITNGSISSLSRLGLDMFFIISGFLIANSLKNSSNVGSFLRKRFLRVFPGLFVCLLVTVFIFGPLMTYLPLSEYFNSPQTSNYLWGSLSLYNFQNGLPGLFEYNFFPYAVNGSLWTLRHEWTLYMLLALFIIFIKRFPRLVLSTIAYIFLILCMLVVSNGITYTIPILNLDLLNLSVFGSLFFLGALALELRHCIKFNFWIALSSTLIVFGLMKDLEIVFYLKLVLLVYLVLWLATIRLPHKINKLFVEADLSYGFYIYAFPIGQGLSSIFMGLIDGWVLALLTVLCTAPFAILSWYLVEKPMLGFKLRVVDVDKSTELEKVEVQAY